MDVAWGNAGEDHGAVAALVYDLLSTHVYQRGLQSRFLDVVRDGWSWMSTEIADFLAGKGAEIVGGAAEAETDGTLILVGHDSDLDGLGVMFGLEWNPAPFPANATVPNSALRFDFDDESNDVSVSYLYTTFESAAPTLRSAPAAFTWVDDSADAGAVGIDALQKRIASVRNEACVPGADEGVAVAVM